MIALIYVDTNSKKRGQIPKLRTIIIYDFMLLYKDNIRPPGNTRVSSASSEPKRTPKPVRANLSALERRTGIAAVVASLVGTRSGFCEGTRWVVSAMGESVFQGDWHGKFMGRIGWRAHF